MVFGLVLLVRKSAEAALPLPSKNTTYRVLVVYQDPLSSYDNDEDPGVLRFILQYECPTTVILNARTCAVDIARGGVWSVRYPDRFIGPGAIVFTQVEVGPSL